MKLKFLRSFAQLKIAILILLIIVIFSILGTIIEQDQTHQYYIENYVNFKLPGNLNMSQVIFFYGLDHIYKTWWFLSLLFLFGTCLISCTFLQQFPALTIARRCNFKTNIQEYKRQEYYTNLNKNDYWKCLNEFRSKKYNIFQQKNNIYLYKGILGRFAPIIVHVALLTILLGNTIAAFGSFNSQELIAKGEIFQIQNTISKNFLTKIPDYPIRVNDFWIEYGINKNIKQFYTDLSILNKNGIELKRKTISVNSPLRYKDLTFYQTDWNAIGIRINQENKTYQLPFESLSSAKNIWISWIPNPELKNSGLTLITNNINGTFSLYSEQGSFVGTFNINDKLGQFKNLNVIEVLTETGLQIKADPGIPLIYLGFGILMISSLVSYFSFSQFWLSKKEDVVLIGAISNRAKLNLRVTFLNIKLKYGNEVYKKE
jgi:cytochrome c biogenesis protein